MKTCDYIFWFIFFVVVRTTKIQQLFTDYRYRSLHVRSVHTTIHDEMTDDTIIIFIVIHYEAYSVRAHIPILLQLIAAKLLKHLSAVRY